MDLRRSTCSPPPLRQVSSPSITSSHSQPLATHRLPPAPPAGRPNYGAGQVPPLLAINDAIVDVNVLLIDAPAWGATRPCAGCRCLASSFNPRARRGRDNRRTRHTPSTEKFQSTRPHGARLHQRNLLTCTAEFNHIREPRPPIQQRRSVARDSNSILYESTAWVVANLPGFWHQLGLRIRR